jgi:hypothetical protein
MSRNPRTKLAAVVAAVVATLGIFAASPATASHAVGGKTANIGSHEWCC